jgi:peptidoglycan-associated lipoprotein
MKRLVQSLTPLKAVLALCLVFAAISCSKKDVKSDEPGFNPSEGAAGAATPGNNVNAGDAGTPASDLPLIYFAFDSYKLDGEAREGLKTVVKYMKDNASTTIQIEGHCDERGTTEYNLALGERRANAARNYLTKAGVDASRVSVISYGSERPAVQGHDESAWAKNRRDAFVIVSK